MKTSKRTFGFLAALVLGAMAPAQLVRDAAPTEVLIETSPRAEVFLDDVLMGKATSTGSLAIHNANPGPHVLRVAASGKHPLTRKIAVAPGKINRIRAELEDFTGDLEILTTPDAEVLLDGKPAGAADGAGRLVVRGLRVAGYKLTAGRAGYNSEEGHVNVTSGVLSTFTIELKRIQAVEEGTSAPPPNYVMERRMVHDQARQVFFSKNGLQLLSIGNDSRTGDSLIQWDTGTGRLLKNIEVAYANTIVDVSPDRRLMAVRAKGVKEYAIKVMDISSGRVVREWPGDSAVFSPDSKTVAIGPTGGIRPEDEREAVFWDVESGNGCRPGGTRPLAGSFLALMDIGR